MKALLERFLPTGIVSVILAVLFFIAIKPEPFYSKVCLGLVCGFLAACITGNW